MSTMGSIIVTPDSTRWHFISVDGFDTPFYRLTITDTTDDYGDTTGTSTVISPNNETHGHIGSLDRDVFQVWISDQTNWTIEVHTPHLEAGKNIEVTLTGSGISETLDKSASGTYYTTTPSPITIPSGSWGWFTIEIYNPEDDGYDYSVNAELSAISSLPLWTACKERDLSVVDTTSHADICKFSETETDPHSRALSHVMRYTGDYQILWFYAEKYKRINISLESENDIELEIHASSVDPTHTGFAQTNGYCNEPFIWSDVGTDLDISFEAPYTGWYQIEATDSSGLTFGSTSPYRIWLYESYLQQRRLTEHDE